MNKNEAPFFHVPRDVMPEDRVPLLKRIAYGFGNFSDHVGTNTLISNANPIFNIILQLDPRLLGLGMGICRLWDALTDPVVGIWSDNTRSRWGRRRPFMLLGAIGAGLSFPILWMVPGGLSGTGLFLWFTFFSILFFSFQTCFSVPWTALGYELTPDYNERTRVMAWRAYLASAVNLLIPWTYAFTQLPIWNGNPLLGVRWMGVLVGLLIILTGLIPVIFLSERFFKKARHQQKTPVFQGIGTTLKNRAFLMMIGITFLSVVGGRTVDHLGFYVSLYYLFDGNTLKQGILTGISGNVALIIGLGSVFALDRLSMRIGKRKSLALCLVLLVMSSIAKWLFYSPQMPYLSLLVLLFTVPSSAGFWLLIASMKADICDDDEIRTGLRREGSIASVSTWISKLSTSATAVLAGVVLTMTGYQAANGGNQDAEVVNKMRHIFYIIPSVSALPALVLLAFFPITEAVARNNRKILEQRRGKL